MDLTESLCSTGSLLTFLCVLYKLYFKIVKTQVQLEGKVHSFEYCLNASGFYPKFSNNIKFFAALFSRVVFDDDSHQYSLPKLTK